jgi:hypothetical protein
MQIEAGTMTTTRYIVFAGFAEPYMVERELSEMDAETTLADLAAGEWENVNRIIAIGDADRLSGFWADVTDLFARQAMNIWAQRGESLTRWQRDFIEHHVSISAANAFPQEAA